MDSLTAQQILDTTLPETVAQTLFASFGLTDWKGAMRTLSRMAAFSSEARQALTDLLPTLLAALNDCADPGLALVGLERFTSGANAADLLTTLNTDPRTLEILVTIFAGSQFLTEILLRNPAHLSVLTDRERLAESIFADEYLESAIQIIEAQPAPIEKLNTLRRYQRGELLRIGACDLLDLYDLPTVTDQLSQLADGMIRACLAYASTQTGIPADDFIVLAMGKLGGGELNYSSDIDLIFLSQGETDYRRLGQQLIDSLSSMTSEGFFYRVDMRLRPWGRDGALVTTLDGYLGYLQRHARHWEKQALLKARPIAGNLELGEDFLRQAAPFIFGSNAEELRTSVHGMKQRTEQFLRAKGREWGEVKLGEGSIRDVEFVIQFLQLVSGAQNLQLRQRATLKAIPELVRANLLTPHEAQVLTDGYIFLRTVEHFLQMMHYRQTYTLPADPSAITLLSRRLGFHSVYASADQSREQFLERYAQHSQAIRTIYAKYVGGVIAAPETALARVSEDSIREHLARMDTSYAATFTENEIRRHASLSDELDDMRLGIVDAIRQADDQWRVTVVAYDYLGELSVICGLLFLHGMDIVDGHIFTYEPGTTSPGRRKIVDVFTVRAVRPEAGSPELWENYAAELQSLLQMMQHGHRREARSELARRVGEMFQGIRGDKSPLYPIELEIDNTISDSYTCLRIQTTDTVGFLYEFTNALSLTHTYIARMTVASAGKRVDDLLFVTDEDGRKITSPDKLRELRTAAVLIKHFTHLLPLSPNPASALLHFRDFITKLFQRSNWPDELASVEQPEVLQNLARLLGVSDFLWNDFMRMQYANLFPVVSNLDALNTAKSRIQLQHELEAALKPVHRGPEVPRDDAPWKGVLNAFKDREMFRIDMRHLLGHTAEFDDFASELTDLAEVVVNSVFHLTGEDLRSLHGTPRLKNGQISQMAVMALGKCGGRELGFASDIELMFVYDGEGQTDGENPIAASAFHEKVVQHFLGAIRTRQEGIFHIDLQLRPYGKAGSMAVSLKAFQRYFAPDGPAWAYERQAMVKLRPIAGDEALGNKIAALRNEIIYTGQEFDVTAMRAMRERQVRHLVKAGAFNAKYSPGGLVDVEYLIQGLQITHGAQIPSLRETNIRRAMDALHGVGILTNDDYTRLHKAHTFLRWLIDSMRVVRGNAKDITVPNFDSEEFAYLARRLRYGNNVEQLRDDLLRYQADVSDINSRLLN